MIKKYKTQLEQHRLAILSELVGSLIHQIKQPLNIISTSMMNLETKSELDILNKNDVIKVSTNINHSIQNISKDLNIFREFFISSTLKQNVDIVDIIHEAISLVNVQFSLYNIDLKLKLPKIYPAKVYPTEFRQMILSILLNLKNIVKKYSNTDENTQKIVLILEDTIHNNLSIKCYNFPIIEDIESRFKTAKLITKEIHLGDFSISYENKNLIFNITL